MDLTGTIQPPDNRSITMETMRPTTPRDVLARVLRTLGMNLEGTEALIGSSISGVTVQAIGDSEVDVLLHKTRSEYIEVTFNIHPQTDTTND